MSFERQISIARDPASGSINVLLWLGIDDPHLVSTHTFASVDALRRYLIGLGRGVGVLWSPDLLEERSLAITVAVALGVSMPGPD